MSDELQSNDDLETQIGNVGTKLLDTKEDSGENSEMWPDKKVYYIFSPSVGKQNLSSGNIPRKIARACAMLTYWDFTD